MTADLLLVAWGVFWGYMFTYSIKTRPPGWFDRFTFAALLALVAFPVLCVYAARNWP